MTFAMDYRLQNIGLFKTATSDGIFGIEQYQTVRERPRERTQRNRQGRERTRMDEKR